MKGIVVLLAVVLLAGCAPGSPGAIARDTPAQLQAEGTDNLCAAEGLLHGAPVLAELQRRGTVRPQFAADIVAQKVAIGMSVCEVIAAWFQPDDVNSTITAGSTDVQWVYEDLDGTPRQYVYFTNDVVTAIQN